MTGIKRKRAPRYITAAAFAFLMISLIASPGPCLTETHMGVTSVEQSDTGLTARTAFMQSNGDCWYIPYGSRDAGRSWKRTYFGVRGIDCKDIFGPRETNSSLSPWYKIEDHDIVKVEPDRETVVYSAAHRNTASAQVVLTKETAALAKERYMERAVTTQPLGVALDARTGTVVAAMGLTGTVAIAPDGSSWQATVEEYQPVDLSPMVKAKAFVDEPSVWAASIALTVAALAAAIAASRLPRPMNADNVALVVLVVVPVTGITAWLASMIMNEAATVPEPGGASIGLITAIAVALGLINIFSSRINAKPLPARFWYGTIAGAVAMLAATAMSYATWAYRDPAWPSAQLMAAVICATIAALIARWHIRHALEAYREERQHGWIRKNQARPVSGSITSTNTDGTDASDMGVKQQPGPMGMNQRALEHRIAQARRAEQEHMRLPTDEELAE